MAPPVTSVPMRLPWTRLPPDVSILMPSPVNRLMTRSEIVLLPPESVSPLAFAPASLPFSSTRVAPPELPSMTTGWVRGGRAVPELNPAGIEGVPLPSANEIVSFATVAFAAVIASRRVQFAALHVPSVVSAAELTVNVAAEATGATATSYADASMAATSNDTVERRVGRFMGRSSNWGGC